MGDVPRCLDLFSQALNNCDGNDSNNPENFKFGSQLDTDGEWEVLIIPNGRS
jgi:hypothetical protein